MTPALITPPIRPLSTQLWGLELPRVLPRKLGHGMVAVPGNFERLGSFLSEEFRWMVETGGAQARPSMVAAKRLYLSTLSDVIELQRDGRCVGGLIGAPEDWSTYYVRCFAISPSAQSRASIRVFIRECLFAPLRAHGVERLVAETSPQNIAMTRLFGELSFVMTGQNLSERWGPMVRYTLFLDERAEQSFAHRYGGEVFLRRPPIALASDGG